jgi:hypothetical protein
MTGGGVFATAREIFDHPFFAKEPFTEREAWIWMVGAAAWKPTRIHVTNAMVDVERGQLAYSGRYLATRWGWSEARVRRFLARLKIDAMIDARTDAHSTRVTICNYDKWQRKLRSNDARHDAPVDARATQIRRKEDLAGC